MREKIKAFTKSFIELLVLGKYKEIDNKTKGNRLTEYEIKGVIAEYKRKLIMPPDSAYDLMDVIQVKNTNPQKWSIAMPLWTKEEGRSDLTLELTLIEAENNFDVELDDLHVL